MAKNPWHTAAYVVVTLAALVEAFETPELPWWRWTLLLGGTAVAILGVFYRTRHPWIFVLGGLLVTIPGGTLVLGLSLFSLALRRRDRWLIYAGLAGAIAIFLSISNVTLILGEQVFEPGDEGYTAASLAARSIVVVLFVVVPILIGAYLSSRRETLASFRDRAEAAESEREARALAAVLAERNRIAGEMHDSLGHRLVLISTQAGGLEVQAGRGAEFVEEHARIIGETARAALAELRETVGALTTATREPAPGVAQIETLVADARASGANVSAAVDVPTPLSPRVDAALYRIAQEGLTNALRHAPGSPVTLTLAVGEDAHLTISNPLGGGTPTPGGGTGLTRLRERVASLSGTLIADDDGAAFTLSARLPLGK